MKKGASVIIGSICDVTKMGKIIFKICGYSKQKNIIRKLK
jgi:hypothetical protein